MNYLRSPFIVIAKIMKKQKKQKFIKFWNKVKKPLMILSIIGNVLFLMFITIGCVASHKKSTQASAIDESRVFTLRNTQWRLNNEIYYTPSGRAIKPVPNTAQTSEIYHISFSSSTADAEFNLSFEWGFRWTSSNTVMYLKYYDSYDSSLVTQFMFYLYGSSVDYMTTEDLEIRFTTELQQIEPPYYGRDDYENEILINWFYDNATLLNGDFSNFLFNKQINYNAPVSASIESPFVSHTFADNEWTYTLNYDFPFFLSNGEIFNRIKLWYLKGYGSRYQQGNQIYNNSNQNTAYYNYMEYVNTLTNVTVMVNYRNYESGNVGTDVQTYITNGSEWVNDNYRLLNFELSLTPTQTTKLSQFNNQNFGDNGFTSATTEVGVGKVFNLLGGIFTSLSGLWAIEILPNITLGLLLFLPLIVGIILTIIWLVKR